MIDRRSCEIRAWKKLGLDGIGTQDLCDTDAVLYQLSYPCRITWELVTLWVRNKNYPKKVKDIAISSCRVAWNFRGILIFTDFDFFEFHGNIFCRIWISDFIPGNNFSRVSYTVLELK